METHNGSHRAFLSANANATVNPSYQSWKQWPQVCAFLVPLCTQHLHSKLSHASLSHFHPSPPPLCGLFMHTEPQFSI